MRFSLEELERQCPPMSCEPGCFVCCGLVPFNRRELARLDTEEKQLLNLWVDGAQRRLARGITSTCPFATRAGCRIYERRPFICRLFGSSTDPRLRCPKGQQPLMPLSGEAAARLTEAYLNLETLTEVSDERDGD